MACDFLLRPTARVSTSHLPSNTSAKLGEALWALLPSLILGVDDSLTEQSSGDPVGIRDQIASPDPAAKGVDPIGLPIENLEIDPASFVDGLGPVRRPDGAVTGLAGHVGPSTLNVVDVHGYWISSPFRDASKVIGSVVSHPEGGTQILEGVDHRVRNSAAGPAYSWRGRGTADARRERGGREGRRRQDLPLVQMN